MHFERNNRRFIYHYDHPMRRLMIEKGISVYDITDRTGIYHETICNILNGKTTHPQKMTVECLAEVFGISEEEVRELCRH